MAEYRIVILDADGFELFATSREGMADAKATAQALLGEKELRDAGAVKTILLNIFGHELCSFEN